MRMLFAASLLALAAAAPAVAQDTTTQGTMGQPTVGQPAMGQPTMGQGTMDQGNAGTTSMPARATDEPTSPDGSKAFGFEPYFGILGGYNSYDRTRDAAGFPNPRFDGALIEGILGVNIPLGPVFIGVEGHGAKGFGDIDWEYGARARAGGRIGESGLIYASAGYTWIEPREGRGFADRDDWVYGLGVEVGPRDIGLGGITGQSGARLRFSIETMDFDSIRPMAGVVFHF